MECEFCEIRCDISPNTCGRCGMYLNENGSIQPRYQNQLSTISIGRIEDIPILHFYPDTVTLLIGTIGCNFDCKYCLNYQTTKSNLDDIYRLNIKPEDIIKKAKAAGCHNIAFHHNEPTVSLPLFLKVARLAKQAGICVGCSTNGYFTKESAEEVAKYVDFMSISLKSFSDAYYQKYCNAPGISPVLRNIDFFHDSGIHLEINTVVTDETTQYEIGDIAGFLSSIDIDIPYSILRLLPEYKMADEHKTPIDKLIAMKKIASSKLNYVYIGNTLGMGWLDTTCPKCATVLIERINNTGCGALTTKNRIKDKKCPNCGEYIPIIYDEEHRNKSPKKSREQKIYTGATGLIDIEGERLLFNLVDGKPVKKPAPLTVNIGNSMAAHPYPGDSKLEADLWVMDMAKDLMNIYSPDLITLLLSQASFSAFYYGDDRELQNHYCGIFNNISLFLEETGYEAIVCGLGGLENITHIIDLEDIFSDSFTFSPISSKYAYIESGSLMRAESRQVKKLERLSDVISRKEFLNSLSKRVSKEYKDGLDDYIAIAHEGVIFKGLNSLGKKQVKTFALEDKIPVYSTIGEPQDISDIHKLIMDAIKAGKKVALVIVEGSGRENFKLPFTECANRDGQLIYTLWQQLYTIATGKDYTDSNFALERKYWLNNEKNYPFSGKFNSPLPDSIGHCIGNHKSLTVGNRSIVTHVLLGADISMECYCCYSHNYGSLSVIDNKLINNDQLKRGK